MSQARVKKGDKLVELENDDKKASLGYRKSIDVQMQKSFLNLPKKIMRDR